MYSQNYETGVLEDLEKNVIFPAQPWWVDIYKIVFLWILQFSVCISVTFFKKKKKIATNTFVSFGE